jgi:Amt family ammonium transporter
VVHISAGFSSLALAIVLGRNQDDQPTSQNILNNLLGTAMLWFGWFGFNGGSALAVNDLSVLAIVNTNFSAAMAGLTWMFLEYVDGHKPSIIGLTNGCVCGLVGITPGCGFVPVWSSFLIGIGSAIISYFFIRKVKHLIFAGKFDDTLGKFFLIKDVFGCHGMSGFWGGIATGLFAQNQGTDYATVKNGGFFGNGMTLAE